MRVKTIAMYLPQFHEVKENSRWWGDGFTDWVSAKAAKKYVESQSQPRVPLNDNYYNLLEKGTLEWQADLAKKYSVYGFAFYHYWFKDGRKILERPAENLLRWKDIDMKFCFSWANATWARSWSRLPSVNTWTELNEKDCEVNGDNGILLLQDYGREEAWREHYDYIKNFFEDERYIKVENEPVFIINRPDEISCINEMIDKWNSWAQKDGYDGIYFIATNADGFNEKFNARLLQEPGYTNMFTIPEWKDSIRVYDYDVVWEKIINRKSDRSMKTFYGGFCDYDDTPRRGRKGSFFKGVSTEKFKKYFAELVDKNLKDGNEFVFLNAWNEWGEGMYLEPDTANGYKYLEAISRGVSFENNTVILPKQKNDGKIVTDMNEYKDKIMVLSQRYKKFYDYFNILNKWMAIREDGKTLQMYFEQNHYFNIAMCGMGQMGKHLMRELQGSKIHISYGIDRMVDSAEENIQVRTYEEVSDDVDAIVVTATFDFDNIYAELRKKCKCPIISLKQIVEEC